MNRYLKYRKANISWLEEVPDHWTVAPLKVVASCNDEVLPESTAPDKQINYVEISDVNAISGIENVTSMPFSKSPSRARRIVRNGDILVSTVRTYLKAIAAVQNSNRNLVASTGFAVIRPSSDNAASSYLGKMVLTDGFIGEIISRSVGVSYPAINASEIMQLKIPLPQLEEQQKIAQFLDYETAKIDALIDEQKRLIELLMEKRQAVISHAVTKGLNPDAPMKDSGVEWLGEVPEHWSIAKLSYVLFLRSGDSITSASIEDSGDYPVYGGNGLRGYTNTYNYSGEYNLIGRQGALCGNINFAQGKFYASEHAVVCTPLKKINVRYFYYLLTEMNIGQYSVSAAQPGISVDRVNQLKMPIPSIEEQNMIASKLDHEIKTQEQTANEAQNLIKLLSERRSALISAAVTGKIDVRDWQPPAGSDTVDSNASVQTERHYG